MEARTVLGVLVLMAMSPFGALAPATPAGAGAGVSDAPQLPEVPEVPDVSEASDVQEIQELPDVPVIPEGAAVAPVSSAADWASTSATDGASATPGSASTPAASSASSAIPASSSDPASPASPTSEEPSPSPDVLPSHVLRKTNYAEANLQVVEALPTTSDTTASSATTDASTDPSSPDGAEERISTDNSIPTSSGSSWNDVVPPATTSQPATQSPQIVRIVYRVNGAKDFQELKSRDLGDGSSEADIGSVSQHAETDADHERINEVGVDATPRSVVFAHAGLSKSAILDGMQRWVPPAAPVPSPTPTPSPSPPTPQQDPYRNWDHDSQERERELEERAREQNHPADDIEDGGFHEVNHFVPADLDSDRAAEADRNATGRWYLLLLAGNSTTVRLRQKDFAKYLKLNLAARLSVEYNDLKVNRVELKPLLVNVTIFTRQKEEKEEAPLHMLAETNATLLELSGEEYHVLRFITIPSEHQEALAFDENRYQSESYTSAGAGDRFRHVDIGVAVYFAVAAALVSILLAVFMAGLWRYLRKLAEEIKWPWRRYKPMVFPKWSLPLQHRMYADHIASCSPLNVIYSGHFSSAPGPVWSDDQRVPVQKILAPEPREPKRLVFTPEPGKAHLVPELTEDAAGPDLAVQEVVEVRPSSSSPANFPPVIGSGDRQTAAAPVSSHRPNSKLSLFGSGAGGSDCQRVQRVPQSPTTQAKQTAQAPKRRLQPQTRHPLDVRIHRPTPTMLGMDNPNYLLQ